MSCRNRNVEPAVERPVSKSKRRLLRTIVALTLAPVAVGSFRVPSASAASGRIEFRIVRAGFILGFGSGSGTLFFKGKRYPLSLGGVSLGATIGASSADFVGRVRNLRQANDIRGNYTAIGAGLAAAGGGTVARLRNSRGVELEVSGKQIGFKASVDLSGLRIRLKR
jgi:lipid-binding SYLF domain-containing protein